MKILEITTSLSKPASPRFHTQTMNILLTCVCTHCCTTDMQGNIFRMENGIKLVDELLNEYTEKKTFKISCKIVDKVLCVLLRQTLFTSIIW